ncbi:hypothetical protein M1L23_02475, partial [Aliidiomarina sp. Y6]|nr:hypothetical protein [Aliidiomarina quisquiliarum]
TVVIGNGHGKYFVGTALPYAARWLGQRPREIFCRYGTAVRRTVVNGNGHGKYFVGTALPYAARWLGQPVTTTNGLTAGNAMPYGWGKPATFPHAARWLTATATGNIL